VGSSIPSWEISFSRLFRTTERLLENMDHEPLLLASKPDGT
jgi:hypothetical protein